MIWAAKNGHFPMVEYLLEKGANMEAKESVSDGILLICSHTYVTHEYMNVSACKDSVVIRG